MFVRISLSQTIMAALYSVALSSGALAQNTVELDQAFEKCRQHEIPTSDNKTWIFAPGWEDCDAIEKIWNQKQGNPRDDHPGDPNGRMSVHKALMNQMGIAK